jgi:hypothetical protein
MFYKIFPKVLAILALIVIAGLAFQKFHPSDSKSPITQIQPTNAVTPSLENRTTEGDISTQPALVQTPVQNDSSDTDLLALADNKYASGNVPLGDGKYVTGAPKKGYVYLCNVHTDNAGSQVAGNWIHGTTWNFLEKLAVRGSVSWPQALFSNVISGAYRILSGNGLPTNHTTGVFPVQSSDPVYKIDRNPNTISAQSLREQISADPVYSETPYCTGGGEVGIMLSGVPLFNAFDAGLRDAPAHEAQDSCDGHPQSSGQYHYHSMSGCFKDIGVSTVLGFALDGFPITGPLVAKDKYLTTEDLDVCHGITSDVMLDGKKKKTYHYVMTQDFPYSISCFRGKPVQIAPEGGGSKGMTQQPPSSGAPQGSNGRTPPQEAVNACSGKTTGSSCSFKSPQGDTISGVCDTPPGSSLACVPR